MGERWLEVARAILAESEDAARRMGAFDLDPVNGRKPVRSLQALQGLVQYIDLLRTELGGEDDEDDEALAERLAEEVVTNIHESMPTCLEDRAQAVVMAKVEDGERITVTESRLLMTAIRNRLSDAFYDGEIVRPTTPVEPDIISTLRKALSVASRLGAGPKTIRPEEAELARKCAQSIRAAISSTTPVEPTDAKLSKVWRDALETAACCADRRGAEDVANAIRRLIQVSEDSSAPVEEREP